ncbi:unnamed protein product [Effrenium voratum]|nr:unnamed protein product [Effrenium voratum]
MDPLFGSFFQGTKICLGPTTNGAHLLSESWQDFPALAGDAVRASRERLGVSSQEPLELVELLDGVSNELCQIADAAELVRNVHPEEAYVQQASAAVQEVANFMSEVNLDSDLYNSMKVAESSEHFGNISLEAQTVLHHMRVSMEHEGIHLPEDAKEQCIQLLDAEQQLSFKILERQERSEASASGAWVPLSSLGALSAHARGLPQKNDEVLLPRHSALADQVLKTSPSAEARRRIHEAVTGGDAEEGMVSLLAVRQHLAKLRGYESWAHYAQRDSLLQSPQHVEHFLEAAWHRLRPGLLAELQILAEEKSSLGDPSKLEGWDLPFLLHRCKQKHQTADQISQYLTYESLLNGVRLILSRLLGLEFTQEEPAPGELWHPSVQKFGLRDDNNNLLGVLYLDPFQRAGKKVQSAQFTLQGSKVLSDGTRQTPKTSLVYALPQGVHNLTPSFALTFMHEIGHAVHSLLSETHFQHLSGTRGTIDFVEFPSHLFEHFVSDPECLASYAVSGAGKSLPLELQRAHRQRPFSQIEAVQQLLYAVVDQAFYTYHPVGKPEAQVAAVQQHLRDSFSKFELDGPFNGSLVELLGLASPSRFDHLVHYGGSYYCYLFNRVPPCNIRRKVQDETAQYQELQESTVFDQEWGMATGLELFRLAICEGACRVLEALAAHVWRQGFQSDPFNAKAGTRLRGGPCSLLFLTRKDLWLARHAEKRPA